MSLLDLCQQILTTWNNSTIAELGHGQYKIGRSGLPMSLERMAYHLLDVVEEYTDACPNPKLSAMLAELRKELGLEPELFTRDLIVRTDRVCLDTSLKLQEVYNKHVGLKEIPEGNKALEAIFAICDTLDEVLEQTSWMAKKIRTDRFINQAVDRSFN